MKKALISLSTAGIIASSLSFPVMAQEEPSYSKEELVYSTINLSGNLESMYVTNLFELTGSATEDLTDYGQYEALHLLNTTHSELSSQNDQASIKTDEARVFTQGKVTDKRLPWTFQFTYLMDGKEVDPQTILDSKGTFTVKVSINPTDTTDEQLMDFVDHYALQVSTSMNLDTHFDLHSPNGITSTAGNKRQVQWTVLPGQEEDLSFTVRTTDFEELDWSINGAPLSLTIGDDLFDLSEFTDPLKELETGIQTLDEGSQTLYDGSLDLTNGMQDLLDGSNQLTDGTSQLDRSSQKLADGTNQAFTKSKTLEEGLSTLTQGSTQLAQASGQLKAGGQALSEESKPFFTGLTDLNQGISSLSEGLEEIETGLNQLDSKSDSLTSGSTAVLEALETMQRKVNEVELSMDSVSQLKEASRSIQTGLTTLSEGVAGMDSSISQYKGKLADAGVNPTELAGLNQNAADNLSELKQQLTVLQPLVEEGVIEESVLVQLQTAIEQTEKLASANAQYISGSDQLINGIHSQVKEDGALRSGSTQLVSSYKEFDQAITTLVDGLSSLPEEIAPLQSAISQLTNQYHTLDQGVQDYTAGVRQLSGGIDKATTAAEQLDNGSSTLLSGGKAIQSGIQDLSNGTTQLQEGASTLNQGINTAHEGSLAFTDGIGELRSGTAQLKDGSHALFVGADDLSNGLRSAKTGSSDLAEGADQLTDGTNELREETSGLPVKTKEKIDAAIEEFSNSDYEIHSYMDERNEETENVQFVIQYRAPEKEVDTTPTDHSEEHESLWQKFLNLFK